MVVWWRQLSRQLSQALGILGIKLSLRSLNVVWSDPNVRSLERWTTKQRRNERNTQKNSKEFQHIPRYSKWASLSLRNHKPSSSVVQHKRVDLRTIAWIILIYIYTYPPMQWIGYHVQIMVFNQIIGIRFCLKSGSLSSQGFESCKYDGMECQLCTSQLAWFNRFKQLQLKKKQIHLPLRSESK